MGRCFKHCSAAVTTLHQCYIDIEKLFLNDKTKWKVKITFNHYWYWCYTLPIIMIDSLCITCFAPETNQCLMPHFRHFSEMENRNGLKVFKNLFWNRSKNIGLNVRELCMQHNFKRCSCLENFSFGAYIAEAGSFVNNFMFFFSFKIERVTKQNSHLKSSLNDQKYEEQQSRK